MMYLFVRKADDKVTTIFDCTSIDDAEASCPTSHRIEPYEEINRNMMRYAYHRDGAVFYSKTAQDAEIETAWISLRADRDRMLSASDWTQAPDAPVDRAAWAAYRQALRDLPANTVDPCAPQWPSPPA